MESASGNASFIKSPRPRARVIDAKDQTEANRLVVRQRFWITIDGVVTS